MQLDEVRRPGAANRLAGHHHYRVAHFELATLQQDVIHLGQHFVRGEHLRGDDGVDAVDKRQLARDILARSEREDGRGRAVACD